MRYSIDSILNQTFTDFELIIADNASTDSTQDICEEYARKDSRVRYFRNDQNMGAPWNFNYTYKLSRAEYFKWSGHDDYIYPTFLEVCLNSLKEREKDGYVSCWPNTEIINGKGALTPNLKPRTGEFKVESTIPCVGF